MAFSYKITSRANSKTCPPCIREGDVSVQRTPGGLPKTIFRYKSQLQLTAKLALPVQGRMV